LGVAIAASSAALFANSTTKCSYEDYDTGTTEYYDCNDPAAIAGGAMLASAGGIVAITFYIIGMVRLRSAKRQIAKIKKLQERSRGSDKGVSFTGFGPLVGELKAPKGATLGFTF
jgi:hypothetical protein